MLNDLVDESDPDIALPNIVHAFQVRILLRYPSAGKAFYMAWLKEGAQVW